MKWLELSLSTSRSAKFDDGTEFQLHSVHQSKADKEGTARVELPNQTVDLIGAVDISETVDSPRIILIYGKPSGELFLLGGTIAYRLESDGAISNTTHLFREFIDLEYWDLQIVHSERGLILIYEGGVMLLNQELEIVWHIRKYYNDIFDSLEKNAVTFVSDHGAKRTLNLNSGELMSQETQ